MPPTRRARATLLATLATVGIGTVLLGGSAASKATSTESTDTLSLTDDTGTAVSGKIGPAGASAARYPTRVRERLFATYAAFGASVAVSAAAAVVGFRSPALLRFAVARPVVYLIGTAGVGFVTLLGMHSIDYRTSPGAKKAALGVFALAQGLSMVPIGFMGGAVVLQALMATGVIVGSLSGVAAVAPSDSFLWMGGPLVAGLGIVVVGSLGSMFFPGSSLLYNVSLYGGLAVFSGFTLYDTQVIAHQAKHAEHYDPVQGALKVYLDSLNIFIRMVQIMGGGQQRRK